MGHGPTRGIDRRRGIELAQAVNNRDKNFTKANVERRRAQLEESVARHVSQLDTADRQQPTEALAMKVTRLTEKLTKLKPWPIAATSIAQKSSPATKQASP